MVKAETGDDLQTINLDLSFEPAWLSLSPDGQRIAVADPLNLAVVDAQTGDLFGTPMP